MSNQKGLTPIILVITFVMVLVVFGLGFYNGRNSITNTSSLNFSSNNQNITPVTPNPSPASLKTRVELYTGYGNFVVKQGNPRLALFYIPYDSTTNKIPDNPIETQKITIYDAKDYGDIGNINESPDYKRITFRLFSPGDTNADYLATLDGSSPTKLIFKQDHDKSKYSYTVFSIIGWIDNNHILVKEGASKNQTGSDQIIFKVVDVNNPNNEKIVNLSN